MKLPEWIPQVSRPHDHEWSVTWNAMTPNERRWSFLFDCGVVAVVFIIAYTFWSVYG